MRYINNKLSIDNKHFSARLKSNLIIKGLSMIRQKHFLLLILLCIPHNTSAIIWPFTNQTFCRLSLYTVALAGISGTGYILVKNYLLQKKFDDFAERFKDQEHLSDRYEAALSAIADYKEFTDIVDHSSSEEQSKQIVEQLHHQFTNNTTQLAMFKKEVDERYQELALQHKEVERALLEWQESIKKALLVQQGPYLKKTLLRILTTLEQLMIHIPYCESTFFIRVHKDSLKDEHDLEPHLSNQEQLTKHLNKLIKNKAPIGEKYPYRAYTKFLEAILNKMLSLT